MLPSLSKRVVRRIGVNLRIFRRPLRSHFVRASFSASQINEQPQTTPRSPCDCRRSLILETLVKGGEAFGDRMRRSVSSRKADKAFDNEKRTLGAMEETDHEEDYQ